jgi:hypothetical protein
MWGKGPNVAVERLAFLLRIPEVSGSNLGPETDYSDYGFHGFPQSHQAIVRIVP